jgi:predicted DNA-binding transcriptional regulator YafY
MRTPSPPENPIAADEELTYAGQILRQWKLMAWLTAEPAGITVAEAAEAFGVNLKTVRRDLILLRRVGFDLVETEEEYNRKRWRIRQPLERLRTKPQRRAAIRDLLNSACEQAELIGDQQLAADLRTLISRVKHGQAGGSNR